MNLNPAKKNDNNDQGSDSDEAYDPIIAEADSNSFNFTDPMAELQLLAHQKGISSELGPEEDQAKVISIQDKEILQNFIEMVQDFETVIQ